MKERQWIVVENASQARILECIVGGDAPAPRVVPKEPASRVRGIRPQADRPRHGASGSSPDAGRVEPDSHPRRTEHEHLAHAIAEHLDDAWARGELESLWIVASSPFLDDLKRELSGAVRRRLEVTQGTDSTSRGLRTIEEPPGECPANADLRSAPSVA